MTKRRTFKKMVILPSLTIGLILYTVSVYSLQATKSPLITLLLGILVLALSIKSVFKVIEWKNRMTDAPDERELEITKEISTKTGEVLGALLPIWFFGAILLNVYSRLLKNVSFLDFVVLTVPVLMYFINTLIGFFTFRKYKTQ